MSVKKALKEFMGFQSMDTRLTNLRHAGFSCIGAVDVGAYHGEWTKSLRNVWNVPVIAVEPQPDCKEKLTKYAHAQPDRPIYTEYCALGDKSGLAEFCLEETNSRFYTHGPVKADSVITVPVSTLDSVVSQYSEKFNILKIDVQGFELNVLNGAINSLLDFEVVILEVSVIPIGSAPTFYEVMRYMDDKDYRLYDFIPMYYRPLDNALWQGDAFFVRNDSSLVSSLQWA